MAAKKSIYKKAVKKKAAAKKKTASKKSWLPVIDVHCHINVPEAAERLKVLQEQGLGAQFTAYSRVNTRPAGSNPIGEASNLSVRLKAMDKAHVDIELVSANFAAMYYEAEPEEAQRIARIANDATAEFVAQMPDRFVGLGKVPFQAPELAAKELEYAMSLGLKGANILTNCGGHDLGEDQYRPFWKKAEELGAVIFVHPSGFTHPQRLQKFRLVNTVGQPLEEALTMLSLIHEGIMEDFPKLKIVMGHGGGYLPFYRGRSDSTFYHHPQTRGRAAKPPSHYIKQFYLDTCVFDQVMIEYLARVGGRGHVVLGTDYPFRHWGAVEMIRKSKMLPDDEKDAILSRNAARLLGLRL
jgi:aminocarboxymuconate-semialdehyde decarboxylase